MREDNDTVGALSMVAFPDEPASWRVLGVSEESREAYRIPELRARVDEASRLRNEQFKLFGEFRQENYDDLLRIQRELRESPERQFPGRLGELKNQWDAYREEQRELVSALRRAELDLEWEIRRVNKSLQRDVAREEFTGETLHKDARVRVATAEGEGIYIITLTRDEVRNEFDAVLPSRWIITAIARENA